MKKIAIGLFTFVITLAIILVVVAQTLPTDYAISATEIIEASPESVYSNIGYLREWEKWSPWKQDDATMTFHYSDNTAAGKPDDWFAWDSEKSGPGKIKVTEVSDNNLFIYNLEMPGMSTPRGIFSLSSTDTENKTAVTWSMKGRRTFTEKIFWKYFNVESEIQSKLNTGLTNIKNLAEKK